MAEERGITMNEFKIVTESFKLEIKKTIEVVNQRFDKVDREINDLKSDVRSLKNNVLILKTDMHTVKEEIALLHEGQTEIKAELRSSLKERVTYQDFNNLDKRVARLERKTA
jgi:chromosome segregation ATPase